jgi:alanine racemase
MSSEVPVHEARIDLSAIRENAAVLSLEASGRPLVADVAADGYGHGAVEVALAALEGGASWILVSDPADADALRDAGIDAEILAARGPRAALLIGREPPYIASEALYGMTGDAALRSAMRVSATVVGVKSIAAGEGVSYGYTYRAETRTTLALVGIGYADGVTRSAGNVGMMRLDGRQRRIAGRVAMNALVLELGDDTARVGDEVVVFGDPATGEPTVHEWAEAVGVSPAEATTGFGGHLPRVYG